VTDVPVPPRTPFSELTGNGLARVWESGAVAPAMFRSLVAVLMVGLLPEVCAEVGKLLYTFGSLTEGSVEERQYGALLALQEMARRAPVLDSFPVAPFVSVNTDAPLRAITDGVEALVAKFKARRNVPETRWRDDVLPDYLEVWDRREGWIGDRYDCAREQTLSEIARELKTAVRTVQNRYRSAFQLIVGHEYTPELWSAVVGDFKWALLTEGVSVAAVSARRPRRTRQRRMVSEATLLGRDSGEGRTGFVADSVAESDTEVAMLRADICELIARGRTNAEIRAELELKDDRFEVVLDHIRNRALEPI
jgi:hypothetical protein